MANNDLNTNDLYQMIAANKAEADQVATLAKGTPTFEANMQSGLVGQDKTLSSATSNYSDAVAQLFAHDKAMAASNTTPSFAPEGYVSNPMTAESTSANLFAQKGQRVADTLKDMETRRNLLGDVVQKAVDLYKSAVQGKQMDYEASKDKFTQALNLLQFEETKSKNSKDYALELAKLSKQSGIGVSDINDIDVSNIDNLDDANAEALAKQYFGPNSVKGGTQSGRGAYARGLLKQIKNGKIDLKVVDSTLDKQQSELVRDAANFIKDAQKAQGAFGTTGSNYWKSFIEGTTGPIAGLGIGSGKEKTDLLNLLKRMKAETIKDYYGSAFTTTEMKNAGWIINPKSQEFQNLSAIRNAEESAYNKMYSALKSSGMDDQMVDLVMKSYGIKSYSEYKTSTTTTTNNRPPLNSFDK